MSNGPEPKTLLGDGRRESLRRASSAELVAARLGRGDGSLVDVGRREDGLNDADESLSDAMATHFYE